MEPSEKILAAHSLDGTAESITDFYQHWAPDYDQDIAKVDYHAIGLIVDIFESITSSFLSEKTIIKMENLRLLDIGCGTGLLGRELYSRGYRNIEGVDISRDMASQAKKSGAYDAVYSGIDINEPISRSNMHRIYDCALSVGVFTPGHAKPMALLNVSTFVKTGGLIIISTRTEYCESERFADTVGFLEQQNSLELLTKIENAKYTNDEQAHYWAFKVL